jgi:hypothetical protein
MELALFHLPLRLSIARVRRVIFLLMAHHLVLLTSVVTVIVLLAQLELIVENEGKPLLLYASNQHTGGVTRAHERSSFAV